MRRRIAVGSNTGRGMVRLGDQIDGDSTPHSAIGAPSQRYLDGVEAPDLLSMLMSAVDDQSGEEMTVEQLKDEVLNVGVGAFETTTSTAAWIFYLLARNPEAERQMHEEGMRCARTGFRLTKICLASNTTEW